MYTVDLLHCRSTQRNNFHPLYTLYTPCNPVVLQGVFVLKCLLTEDVLLKIENTYRGSEMKIVTLVGSLIFAVEKLTW